MEIKTRFTFDKVRFDQDNDIHLVASLKAPKQEAQTKRPTVCVTVALDVSGSMSGEKLDYAKKTLTKLVDHLQPGDYVGFVTFGSEVEVVLPTQEVTQYKKDEFKAKIKDIGISGSTNLSGGMLEALSLANKMDLPDGSVNRIILLTDGHPNVGVAVNAEDLTRVLTKNLGKATASMFGYGLDTNHELLSSLARIGKGNFAFIANPDDAVTAFAKELGGLLSTYAQKIRIELAPQNGHSITEVVSDVDAEGKDNNVIVQLPDLLSEEERHIVFAVKLAKQKKALPRPTTAFNLNVTYTVMDADGKAVEKTETLKSTIELVKAGEEQTKATEAVDQIVGIAQLVKRQVEAEAAAARGDYRAAHEVFQKTSADYSSRGLGALMKSAGKLGENYTAQNYVHTAGLRSAVRSSGSRGMSTSSADENVQAYFAGTGAVFENSIQASVGASFAGGAPEEGADLGAAYQAGIVAFNAGAVAMAPPVAAPVKPEPAKAEPEKPKKISKKRSARW